MTLYKEEYNIESTINKTKLVLLKFLSTGIKLHHLIKLLPFFILLNICWNQKHSQSQVLE